MSGRSVFAVDRGIWTDPDFDDEPFTQREAWLWIVSSAAFKSHRVRGQKKPIEIERGEFCFSVRFLAERWRWSKDRVHRFLKALENRDMIRDTSRDSEKIYSVKNYNKFQVVGLPPRDSDEDADRDATATEARHDRDKEETGKQEKQEYTSSLRSEERVAAPTPPPRTAVRGARLPPDWRPNLDDRAFAAALGASSEQVDRTAESFRDYWHAKSGKDAVKVNWSGTWRNWCRRENDAGRFRSGAPPPANGRFNAGVSAETLERMRVRAEQKTAELARKAKESQH